MRDAKGSKLIFAAVAGAALIVGQPKPTLADTITFDDLLTGKISFGFDADSDSTADVIFSTTDRFGFNTIGPGTNQNFVNEPGLEGTSELNTDLRVDFVSGARNELSFGFALNSSTEDADFRANMTVFDRSGRRLGSTSTVAGFTQTNLGRSSFPEGEVRLSFSGEASYATLNFESEFGRHIVDDFTGDFTRSSPSAPTPTRPQLQASVIESGFNFIGTADDVTARRNEINAVLNECTSNNGRRNDGTPCDYAAIRRGEVEANIDLVKDANEVAFASKDLVTRTSALPGESVIEWIADLPFLVGEALGFFKVVGSLEGDEENPEIESASVDGEIGEFSINPDFTRYDLDFVVDFSSDSLFEQLVGQQFLFDYSFTGEATEIGIGTVKSVGTNLFGGETVAFNFVQLGTNDQLPSSLTPVPLPAAGWLLLGAIAGLLGLNRRKAGTKKFLPTLRA